MMSKILKLTIAFLSKSFSTYEKKNSGQKCKYLDFKEWLFQKCQLTSQGRYLIKTGLCLLEKGTSLINCVM